MCFRCGGHGGVRTIAALLGITQADAREVIKAYGGTSYHAMLPQNRDYRFGKHVELPPNGSVDKLGRNYLEARDFDPDKLIKLHDLRQTMPTGKYNYRLLIPVKYHGYNVSYTARSIINHDTRYMSCTASDECVPIKDVLYFIDEVPGRNRVVVMEGCFHVFRFGPGSVATFGTAVTPAQLKLLTAFKRVVLFQDLDDAGEAAWQKVASRLRFAGSRLDVIKPDSAADAADIPQVEADYLMRTL